MGAFRSVFVVALLAVGCGGRTNGTDPSATSGTKADMSDDGGDAHGGGGIDTPPSCAPGGPGITNCGPGGSGTESCCTSLEVTGGTFYRTYDDPPGGNGYQMLAADGGPTGEADPATDRTGTKPETADTDKASLHATAPAPDPTSPLEEMS